MMTIQWWVSWLFFISFTHLGATPQPFLQLAYLFPDEEAGLEASYPQTGGEGVFDVWSQEL